MSSSFGSNHSTQEVELNITPIIDCFTVLITFLLASASFLSIGFFETGLPGNTQDAAAIEPNTEVSIRLSRNHEAEFKVKGIKNETIRFDIKNHDSMKLLEQTLVNLKDPSIKIGQVLISADEQTEFKEITEIMGHLNALDFPVVIGEF